MSSARRLTALAMLAIALSGTAFADSITVNLTNLSMSTVPGGSVTFDGSITNDTGFSLSSADLFFNFFNFDPGSISPTQLLGSVDFTIGNGATSGVIDLFSVMVADGVPLGSTFPMDLTLEDINNDASGPITVETGTGHGTVTPEPGTLSLCLMGATLLTRSIARARQRRRPRPS
jgi:hypothetical protein